MYSAHLVIFFWPSRSLDSVTVSFSFRFGVVLIQTLKMSEKVSNNLFKYGFKRKANDDNSESLAAKQASTKSATSAGIVIVCRAELRRNR